MDYEVKYNSRYRRFSDGEIIVNIDDGRLVKINITVDLYKRLYQEKCLIKVIYYPYATWVEPIEYIDQSYK